MSHEKSQPQDTGGPSRLRSMSESSSDDGSAQEFTSRRQRTTSQTYMVASGLTANSPPKFVTLEEIMQAANGMRDMNLVHQIVVDDNFRLEKTEPEGNTIHKLIKETMHKAFWDVLKQQLEEDPPTYTQAFILLEEIKQSLLDLLLPQSTKLRQEITEVLDIPLIKQQAEKGVLDFPYYATYIINIMAKMCASIRDENIEKLREKTDIVEVYKGILETLELMRLDMANFTLQAIKPDIIKNSVELERKKFASFLAIQPDGLENTRNWLLRHVNTSEAVPKDVEYEKFITTCSKRAFIQACVELLDWDRTQPYPETFVLDEERLYELQKRSFRIVAAATVMLVTLSNAGADLQSLSAFKTLLKDRVSILLQSVNDLKGLTEVLPNVAEQVLSDVKEAQLKYSLQPFSASVEALLKKLIVDIGKDDHTIRGLVKQRVQDFFLDIIESASAAPQKVPTGLTAFGRDLTGIAGQFLRIVSHNSTVFCIYYYDIVAAALPKTNY